MQPVRQTQAFTNSEAQFGGPPGGFVWSVQLNVPTAQNSDTFQLYINGEQLTSTAGTGLMGPVQVFSGETVTIKSSTVAAGTKAFLYGQLDKMGQQPSGIFPAISGGVVTTSSSSSYPLSPPQSGNITANVNLPAATSEIIMSSGSLAIGTWLVTANININPNSTTSPGFAGFWAVINTGAATIAGGASASLFYGDSGTGGGGLSLSLSFLVVVTASASINFYAESSILAAALAQGSDAPAANSTGWTATRVA